MIPTTIHDVVTGSDQDGTGPDGLNTGPDGLNCTGWTSNVATDQRVVGHADGMGPQRDDSDFGWVRAHPKGNNASCDPAGLAAGGGDGRIYCFAAD